MRVERRKTGGGSHFDDGLDFDWITQRCASSVRLNEANVSGRKVRRAQGVLDHVHLRVARGCGEILRASVLVDTRSLNHCYNWIPILIIVNLNKKEKITENGAELQRSYE